MTIKIGDRVTAGEGEDRDTGSVQSVEGDMATVSWDSGVATPCPVADLDEMATMLERHGSTFSGNSSTDTAQDWLDNDFDADAAGSWCEIGCWDATVAAELRDTGLTPAQVDDAATKLRDAEDAEWDAIDEAAAEADPDNWTPCNRDSKYTDGDPIYSVCNNDTPVQELINAAKE